MMELLVNIDVDDLDRAVAFYSKGIGLRPGRRLFDGSVVEMTGGPVPIYLIAQDANTSASFSVSVRRDYRRHWTPVHLDFVIEDVNRAVRDARAAGATLERDVQAYPWGRIATLSDPFGHGFCLLQFVGEGYDAVTSGG